MKFSEIEITEQRYELYLGETGLYARVNPTGSISIYYKYSVDGTRSKLPLGKYPDLSQAEILKEYRKARGDVAKGLDPLYEKEKRKQEIRQERLARKNEVTVATAAEQWLKDIQYQLARSTYSGYRSCMKCHVSQSPIWRMPIKDVTYQDLKAIIEKIHKTKTPAAAGNVKAAISALFTWSITAGYLQYSVAFALRRKSSDDIDHDEKPVRTRVLTNSEIKDLWFAFDDHPGSYAAKMVLLTGCRPKEIAKMHSKEIQGDWWTFPRGRSKTRKSDFRVYLTPLARSLLKHEEGFMFPSTTKGNQSIGDRKGAEAFDRARELVGLPSADRHEPDGVRQYDFRRTLCTRVAEQFPDSNIHDVLLSHSQPGTQAVYNQYKYDKQKQEALLWWDAELTRILGLGKVFKLAV